MRYSLLTSCAIAAIALGGGLANAQAPTQAQPPGQTTEQNRPSEGSRRQGEPAGKQPTEEKSNANTGRRDGAERRGDERSEGRDRLNYERGRSGEEGRREDRRYRTERDFDRDRSGRFEDRGYRERYEERRSFDDRRYGGRAERGYEGPRHLQISRRQRARVHDFLIRRRVDPVDVDFPVRVGARVPNYISSYELPDEIYDYAPGYEGYRYFVTRDEVIIVDPATMEIVAVLDDR
jgi:hypothetical protein